MERVVEQGPRRAALALPDIRVADRVASDWGECVWTDPWLYRIRCLDESILRAFPVAISVAPPRRRRLRSCVETWPGCETGTYDPRCCRFPKSCSSTVYDDGISDDLLEPAA